MGRSRFSVTISLARCSAARNCLHAIALSFVLLLSASVAGAHAAEPVSFKGKTVLMLIGYAPGGGTDIAGRLIAQYLGKYLPGEPQVLIQNKPGADGLNAMNYFPHTGKPGR